MFSCSDHLLRNSDYNGRGKTSSKLSSELYTMYYDIYFQCGQQFEHLYPRCDTIDKINVLHYDKLSQTCCTELYAMYKHYYEYRLQNHRLHGTSHPSVASSQKTTFFLSFFLNFVYIYIYHLGLPFQIFVWYLSVPL